MSNCPACQDAQKRPTHLYIEGCVTCDVRRISNEPQHIRLAHYATIADPEEREAFQTAVALEYRRRKGFQP
jgi:hypothetical protein